VNARAALAAALAAWLAPAAAGAAAPAGRPAVALSASPAHVTLAGAARATVRLANEGAAPVVVDVAAAGFALDARGRPLVRSGGAGARLAGRWLRLRPARVALAPGQSAAVQLRSAPPRGAGPGDHPALVLATTRPGSAGGLAVRMRLGVTVVVRVPGRIVHRLELRSLRVRRAGRRRVLRLVVSNRGNVVEALPRGALAVVLRARGRLVARLRAPARELLPRSSGVFELRCPRGVRGRLTARVALPRGAHGRAQRSFRLRL